jgi:hypothetical protein
LEGGGRWHDEGVTSSSEPHVTGAMGRAGEDGVVEDTEVEDDPGHEDGKRGRRRRRGG